MEQLFQQHQQQIYVLVEHQLQLQLIQQIILGHVMVLDDEQIQAVVQINQFHIINLKIMLENVH